MVFASQPAYDPRQMQCRKEVFSMRINNFRWLLLVPVAGLVSGQASAACSNHTLHGNYAFHISGQILAPAPVAGVVSGVALTWFDGSGYLNQVDHAVHNGVPPMEDWRPGEGTYSINTDCTGWMTITQHPTDPADGGPELKLYIVVTEDGNEVQTVVSDSPTAAAFAANITSTGVRRSAE
jgi:hypothetical protein